METSAGMRALLRQRMWRRWTVASFLARLPVTMTLLALVLVGEAVGGSVAIGAQLSGIAIAVSGLVARWRGRQLDRRELRGGLQRACLTSSGVLLAMVSATLLDAPLPVFYVLAVVLGLAFSAISGGFRALLVPVVPAVDLARANALEAVFVEVAFVAGPALAGLAALAVGAPGVLAIMAGSMVAAAAVATGLPRLDPVRAAPAGAPWRLPGVWPVYVLALLLGVAVGVVEAAVPGRAVELGRHTATAGLLLTLIAAGSAAGGVAATMQHDLLGRVRLRAALLLAALGLLLVPPGLAGSLPWFAAALFAVGIPIAPLNALGSMVLQQRIPAGHQSEGFSVYVAAIMLGAGAGQSLGGRLLEPMGAAALLIGSAGLPLAAAAAVAASGLSRRRRASRGGGGR